MKFYEKPEAIEISLIAQESITTLDENGDGIPDFEQSVGSSEFG